MSVKVRSAAIMLGDALLLSSCSRSTIPLASLPSSPASLTVLGVQVPTTLPFNPSLTAMALLSRRWS
ncbi:hypothetical protein HNQ08_004328 [Deinococcus humi]|uniref:Uncharacterized protein n=1 Tax=Deinococcus humi TaxID=662880 RepID=A0A7W8NIM6_9DEIO|nr:hypothetical protein [Deinococcus humi]